MSDKLAKLLEIADAATLCNPRQVGLYKQADDFYLTFNPATVRKLIEVAIAAKARREGTKNVNSVRDHWEIDRGLVNAFDAALKELGE